MMLSDTEIQKEQERARIVIDPFDYQCLGGNSYDVHLSSKLATYKEEILDCKRENAIYTFDIPPIGLVLQPNILYLGSTLEYTETHAPFVPIMEGKSSLGRLGLTIHVTAGVGDVGFMGHWTLEMSVIHPLRIYANMPIGQIMYFEVKGKVNCKYYNKLDAKYNQQGSEPVGSKMWRNFKDWKL